MITSDGWWTGATRIPGIPDKQYSQPNTGIGFGCHSVVGSAQAALNRFLSTDRLPNGQYTPAAAASCTFILKKNGELIQMYPVTASTWTSGSRGANTQYIPLELEGGALPDYSEPMTDAQVATFVLLIRDLETFKGIKYVPNVNMLQHKQLVAMYGGGATACASDRYQRGYDALMEEDMTAAETQAMIDASLVPVKAQLDSLNKAIMDREYLRELASGPIADVRSAIAKLEES